MATKHWTNTFVSSRPSLDIVSWRGGWFAPITVLKLQSIPSYVGIVQGGLSFAKASAKTHAGIGAGDISVRGMNKDEVWKLCEELWGVNIIPCPRGFVSDSFQGRSISNINDGNEHVHFLDCDSVKYMHPQAQAQVKEILDGGDGLLGNAHYTGPSIKYRKSWDDSKFNPVNVKKKELELPTTAEVVKALTNDDTFIKTVAQAAAQAMIDLDAVPNEWSDKDADPSKPGSKPNPTISIKTSLRRHDKQTLANAVKLDKLYALVEARFPEEPATPAS